VKFLPRQLIGRAAAAAVVVALLCGCTQQLAQRSQNHWLKSLAQPAERNPVDNGTGALQGEISTVLSGYLESASIGELSGLAASHRNPGVFWAINDSGNRAELFAVDANGKHIDTFKLPPRNIDWEDLASFQNNGRSWLMIGDTGDNLRRRQTSFLYVVEEPAVNAQTDKVAVHTQIEFSYEDGPQNVESIAVSETDQAVYLVAKRGAQSSLYQLPLSLKARQKRIAKRIGTTSELYWGDNNSWLERRFGSRFLLGPTAMDISADNRLAVIANYRHLYLYRRAQGQPWSAVLRDKPDIIASHRMAQSESVAFSADGSFIIVGSEGIHAPVLRVH
jgi:hypothetical protein